MKFNYKTVTRKILADLYTPVGVYMRLRDIYPQSALMESSDYHGSENSRSFIGVHPLASIAVSHGEVIKTFTDLKYKIKTAIKDRPDQELVIAGDRQVVIGRLLRVLTFLQTQGITAANILMQGEQVQ